MDSINFRVQLVLKTTPYFNVKLFGSQESRKVKTIDFGLSSRTILSNRILTNFFIMWSWNNQIGSRWNRYVQGRRVNFNDKLETTVQHWVLRRKQIIEATNKCYGFMTIKRLLRLEHQIFSLCLRARMERKPKS